MNELVLYAKLKKYTDAEIQKIQALSPLSYKGSVANYASLPTNASKGDLYTTSDNGKEYVWDGSNWIELGSNIDDLEKAVATNTEDIAELKVKSAKRFGFRRDRSSSNPATRIEYIGDAEGLEPFSYDFTNQVVSLGGWEDFIKEICRPVMLNYDGSVAYELDRDDTTKKIDGTDSDIANSAFAGNAMVEFGKYRYVSRLTIGDYDYVYFSDTKINDTYKDYAFIGEDGEAKEHFYFSMFEGSYDNTQMRSLADATPMVSQTAVVETTRAKANGDGWNIGAWSQLNYIWDLLTLIGKSDNLQATFGQGWSSLSSAGTTGGSKDKGAFYGKSTGDDVVRTLYIEDIYGRIWDRYNGLINDNGTFKARMTPPYPTPSDVSTDYANYNALTATPAEGYVKTATCGEFGFIPTATGGAGTTFFCDYFYKNDSGVKFAIVGGTWDNGAACGRYVHVGNAYSYASAYIGSRLLKL